MVSRRVSSRCCMVLAVVLAACSGGGPAASPSVVALGSSGPSATAAPTIGAPTANPALDQEAVFIPGTHIAMVPPAGFVAATSFAGFEHESGASVLVAELPAAYGELIAGMTDAGFAGQGITVKGRSQVTVDGRAGTLIEGTQSSQGITFGKLILITGTDHLTATLTGNYPIGEAGIGDSIRAAVLSMSFDPELAADPQGALSFIVTPAPPLVFAGAFANAAAYNTSGTLPSADIDEPFFIVAPSFDVSVPGDLESFALKRLLETATIRDIEVVSTETTTIAGRDGIVHVASAVRVKRPGDVVVYQVMLGGDGDYVVMTGICSVDRRAECLEAFAATARTFMPKP